MQVIFAIIAMYILGFCKKYVNGMISNPIYIRKRLISKSLSLHLNRILVESSECTRDADDNTEVYFKSEDPRFKHLKQVDFVAIISILI